MIPLKETSEVIESHLAGVPLAVQNLPVREAGGYILAEDVRAGLAPRRSRIHVGIHQNVASHTEYDPFD